MENAEAVLDNPSWYALTTHQKRFAIGNDVVKMFPKDVVEFTAFPDPFNPNLYELARMLNVGDVVLIAAVSLPSSGEYSMLYKGHVRQYIYRHSALPGGFDDESIVKLSALDIENIVALSVESKLGKMENRAIELGNYFGIYSDGKLVSMAGERLHVGVYREISDVCTAPEHVGKGMATKLVVHAMKDIMSCGEVPFLHVSEENERAIRVYERLGFEHRTNLPLQIVQYVGTPGAQK
jgi:ribosomal protein S18 acetylase RimI-like enzyme